MNGWNKDEVVVLKGYHAIMAGKSKPDSLAYDQGQSDAGAVLCSLDDVDSMAPNIEPHAEAFPIELIDSVEFTAPVGKDQEEPPTGAMPGIVSVGADGCEFSGRGVTVAVLDTGIEAGHEAFEAFEKVDKFKDSDSSPQLQISNFTDEDENDSSGHGTHCTGILCGRAVNGRRIGVADGVNRLLVAKVLGEGGNSSRLIKALDWALEEGAQIISMSLSYSFWEIRDKLIEKYDNDRAGTSEALRRYLETVDVFRKYVPFKMRLLKLENKQTPLIFAAVGNTSKRPDYAIEKLSPSSAPGVLAIGASDGCRAASFSNDNPDLVAPGVQIWSADKTDPRYIKAMSGTSQACPHAAGIAALYWEQATKEFKTKFGNSEVDVENWPSISDIVKRRMLASADAGRDHRFPCVTYSEVGNGEATAP